MIQSPTDAAAIDRLAVVLQLSRKHNRESGRLPAACVVSYNGIKRTSDQDGSGMFQFAFLAIYKKDCDSILVLCSICRNGIDT